MGITVNGASEIRKNTPPQKIKINKNKVENIEIIWIPGIWIPRLTVFYFVHYWFLKLLYSNTYAPAFTQVC